MDSPTIPQKLAPDASNLSPLISEEVPHSSHSLEYGTETAHTPAIS